MGAGAVAAAGAFNAAALGLAAAAGSKMHASSAANQRSRRLGWVGAIARCGAVG